MDDEQPPSRWQAKVRSEPMSAYAQAQAVSLTMVLNALVARVGPQEATHMVLAGAVALADKHLSRALTISWLRSMADTLEQEPSERAN
jgi:hypothetical protein